MSAPITIKRIRDQFIAFLRRKKLVVIAVLVFSTAEILEAAGAGAVLLSMKGESGLMFYVLLLLRIVAFVLIATWCVIQIFERYQKERQEK
ncbi:hypothetical protein SAMN04515618_12027 [Collimonas sp. OK307]|uniref:hypothetical protein n=1 Tax=Collimonas sp. OK307 TaxID=1801620 RepID=UPI0008E27816|nr:hypothetical protein [Collimonas sp. OK307]SFI37711.1 hypothetical protein SAMN04515618_12027 [Collimonas sp. OK307]